MKPYTEQPNTEQIMALRAYAEKYGHGWKASLYDAWFNGTDTHEPDGHLLRQVRNRFGPSWLQTFKPCRPGKNRRLIAL